MRQRGDIVFNVAASFQRLPHIVKRLAKCVDFLAFSQRGHRQAFATADGLGVVGEFANRLEQPHEDSACKQDHS